MRVRLFGVGIGKDIVMYGSNVTETYLQEGQIRVDLNYPTSNSDTTERFRF